MAKTEDDAVDDIMAFVGKWGLEADTIDFLQGLAEDVRHVVLKDFVPREDTKDVAGKMRAFAKSVELRARNEAESLSGVDLTDFINKWQLDDAAADWLASLHPNVQRAVLKDFSPKSDTRDVVGKLKCFARSIMNTPHNAGHQNPRMGRGSMPMGNMPMMNQMQMQVRNSESMMVNLVNQKLMEFSQRYGMDERSLSGFRQWPLQVQVRAVEEFKPKSDTNDMGGKLCAFARSIANANGYGRQRAQEMDPVMQFAMRWGLAYNDEAKHFLYELPDFVREKVFREFAPREDTRDMVGKLKQFARGIMSSGNSGLPGVARRSSTPPWQTQSGQMGMMNNGSQSNYGERQLSDAQVQPGYSENPVIQEFLDRWGIAMSAVAILENLDDRQLEKVVTQFSPKEDTKDVTGKVIAFAKSMKGPKGAGRGGGSYQAEMHQSSMGSRGGCWGTSEGAWGVGGGDDVGGFMDRYNLDEGCRAMMRGFSDEIQATIMTEFKPGNHVKDTSGQFCSFARSVASRMNTGGGVKRPMGSQGGMPSRMRY